MATDRVGAALVATSAAGFATLAVLGKLAFAAGLSTPTVLALRFVLATAIIWAVFGVRGQLQRLGGRALAAALALGTLGYATMSGLFFWGLEYLSAGVAGIVLYTFPVFVVAFGALVLDESVTRRTLVALACSLSGVALVTGADPAGVDPRGVAIVLGAALVYAGYVTASRATLASVDSRVLTAHVIPAAAVVYVGYGALTGHLALPASVDGWAVVVAIAVVATVLPIFTFFAGLARVDASRAAIISTVEPAITVGLGALVLDEAVTPVTVAGGTLVLAGVLLVQR